MMPWPWSFLLEGDVGLYQPNRQKIVLMSFIMNCLYSLLHFRNAKDYPFG